MRIIHFSDSHFRPGNNIAKSQKLTDHFINALKEIHAHKAIDLIIFSGDMVDKGGDGFPSMDNAFAIYKKFVIDEILKSIGLSQERFIFVCGNHDVVRGNDSKYEEKGLLDELTNIQKLDDFVRDPDSLKHVKRIEPYNKFRTTYYLSLPNVDYHETPFQSNLILTIDGKKVCISMLNSSWRCWDSKTDKSRILMGQAQIIDSANYLKDADIRIGVSHHDHNWFNEFERPNLPKLIVSNYDMYFCGHTHGADAEMTCRPEGNTFIFTAPGLLHQNVHELNGNYRNGFMLIDYDKDRLKIAATKYYQDFDETFKVDHNYAENGVWERDIPAGPLVKMNSRILDVYDHLSDGIAGLDSHLIGYSTSTSSPKKIDDIFVMPTLSYKEQSKNELNPINTVSLSSIADLLDIKGNIVIFGQKESGKTILLDKIFIEILNNRRNEGVIPVMLKFSSIKTNIAQSIANIWNERLAETQSILKEKKVVLLIDDLLFDDSQQGKEEIIASFLCEYPNVRLIATTLSQGGFSFEKTSISKIPFKGIKIDSFKNTHIRELACKWSGVAKENAMIRSRIDYIIKAFAKFRIPCTPFSVTLLLWILEKGGQCQPSNMALLLDCFITEMLKDCNGDFTQEKFNQDNKKHLLANIAFAMHQEEINSVNEHRTYHFTYANFLEVIEKHLESMELKMFKAKTLAEELLQIGLFVQDKNKSVVYFRFRCFMEYFLAKKMQMTESFFTFVLEEDNYLNYCNEIFYFTGLTRDKVTVLQRIFTRLEVVFYDMRDALDKVGPIDDFFIHNSLIEVMGSKDVDMIMPMKHSEKNDDETNNEVLEHNEQRVAHGDKKRNPVTTFEELPKLLLLAMDVLRNTEETDEGGFRLKLQQGEDRSKAECFNMVVTTSLYFAIAIYITFLKFINDYKDDPSKKAKVEEVSLLIFLLPVLQEELLSRHLGTLMLADHIKAMIKEQAVNQTSEFQNFVATFMYADLKADKFMTYVRNFVSSYKRQYIADAIYLKLIKYFYDSDSNSIDKELAELMATVYMKSHQPGYGKKWQKDVLINKFLGIKK